MKDFDYQPNLVGPGACMRGITDDDFDGLYQCASDPRVWAGHPAKDRYKKDVFTEWFKTARSAKALVLTRRDDEQIMGSSRYYTIETAPAGICIGFTFLGIDFWGGAVNREMKALMLAHAFTSFDNVWFHIDASNLRSQAATAKIGARFVRDEVNSMSSNGSIWKCYAMSKSEWDAQ